MHIRAFCRLFSMSSLVILIFAAPEVLATSNGPERTAPLMADYGSLPLVFIENRGQAPAGVKYYQQGPWQSLAFTRQEIRLTLAGQKRPGKKSGVPQAVGHQALTARQAQVVRLEPVGMSRAVRLEAGQPREGRVNYLLGHDPARWRTNIPTYGTITYRNAYPGIDLMFYGNGQQLEYDIIVRPGADPNRVKFRYAGVQRLEVTPAGDLAIHLPSGSTLLQKKPQIYQEIAGQRVPREGKFRLHANVVDHLYSFQVGSYDHSRPLVIDPVLVYSTFLGGEQVDVVSRIKVDEAGCVYLAGNTSSDPFPTTSGAYQTAYGGGNLDVFIAKLNAAGNGLIYCTYLGGEEEDQAYGLAVDRDGNAYVTGFTYSTEFPLVDNIPTITSNGYQGFVAQLNATGDSLVYSTYLGGSLGAKVNGVALDGAGNAYVTGETQSDDFPLKNPIQSKYLSFGASGFVTKLSPKTFHEATGLTHPDLVYSTFLTGSESQGDLYIAVDQTGFAAVVGWTNSTDFPLLASLQEALAGGGDAFVARFDPDGGLTMSTLLGGSRYEYTRGVALDQTGAIYVIGQTSSNDFPLKNHFRSFAGYADTFVAKIRPPAPGSGLPASLEYSTCLGAYGYSDPEDVAVDKAGCVYMAGTTDSYSFPLCNPLPVERAGIFSAFVAKLNAAGNDLLFSTYLGGSGGDFGMAVAVDLMGNIYAAGETNSADFPVTNQKPLHGSVDAFITKIGGFQPPRSPFRVPVGAFLLLLDQPRYVQ
jgi:hypothetical protein